MKLSIFPLTLLLALQTYAYEGCDEIVNGYEASDTIYVMCDGLEGITTYSAERLVKSIFDQYTGEMGEIFIFFINDKNYIGKTDLPSNVYVADFYTHYNQLILWPKIRNKKRLIKGLSYKD